jgi:radical SAM superfamily enzyme YgiQ (UPF0313 family)
MKVRLIQPSQLDERGCPVRFKQLFFPSLTLPTIAALTPDGIDVAITTEYVEEVDFDEDVDLVGITAQTCQAPRAYQIADEFRKRGRRTIMGGIHASACPEEALGHFDSVLIGEAEGLWQQVLADARASNLRRIYQKDVKPDMAELAVPRYDLLDYRHYVVPPLAHTPLIPIQTTRGCPHDCDFCSVSQFWGHKIRKKPVRNVMKEIETIQPSRIFFSDDNIGADPEYATELFSSLKTLKKRWACQMSSQILRHPQLIQLAGEAGCHETLIGLESLAQESLNGISKGFNKVGEFEDLLKRLKDVGILAQVSLIFGLDGDTPDGLRKTIDTILEWDINYIYIALLTPFPATRLHKRLTEEKRITGSDWSAYDVTRVVFQPRNMSGDELLQLVWEMFEKCYTAGRILGRLWRFKREYTLYFPRDNAIEETFFQFHMRNAIRRRSHPFSLGLTKD